MAQSAGPAKSGLHLRRSVLASINRNPAGGFFLKPVQDFLLTRKDTYGMNYAADASFEDLLNEGGDFFALFGKFAESFDDMTLFGLSDEDLAELV